MIQSMNAGDFSESFNWLVRVITRDFATGADAESFPGDPDDDRLIADAPVLWGSLVSSTGQEATIYGERASQSDAVITLRQFPAVSALDRLYHKRSGLIYDITGKYIDWQKNQVVLQATVLDNVDRVDQ